METIYKEHVSSGSFRAETKKALILQAFLGTCVGVALYDKNSGIGGMIHILLPEPPSEMEPEFPEKYASTGLPLFINKLKEMGAHPDNLKAVIAGGALVGPVSYQDINLDLGGRSVEIAISILKKAKIKIVKAETGGFFTCTLELDMQTGQTMIKPVEHDGYGICCDHSHPSKKEITETIENLQPIPQTALKIMRLIKNGDYEVSDITDELAKDQVLSARTLHLCNSSLFAGIMKIETLNDAVLLLGESMLVQSILTAAVHSYYNQTGTAGYSLCKGGLFFHALGCAVAAEKIAQTTKTISPQKAYTAGLLHDIGKVVLDQYIANISPMFFREIQNRGKYSLDVEKKFLGTDHCNTGAFLAAKWNFPKSLIEVILYHHNPEKAIKHKKTVCIIYIANLLMAMFNTGFEIKKTKPEKLALCLDTIGLKPTDFSLLIDAIPLGAFDVRRMDLWS